MDSPEPEDSPPATPVATPSQHTVRLEDVTATVASLSLTPSVDAPSSGGQGRYRRRDRRRLSHTPRKLFVVASPTPEPVPSPGPSTNPEARPEASSTDDKRASHPWSIEEIRALVAFLLLYSQGHSWPSRSNKEDAFWVEAGQYVQKAVKTKYCRSGELLHANFCMYYHTCL